MKLNSLAALKWIIAIAVAEWLRVPDIMRALVILMTIDYVSGFIAAIKKKEVSSEVGFWGLIKKMMTILLLLACHLVEGAIGAEWKIEQIAAFGYCVNEAVSVIENCSRIGVPIPVQLVSVLMNVQKLRSKQATSEQLRELADNQEGQARS